MTKEEIIKKIDEIEDYRFYLEMQNFLDWEKYDAAGKELKELKEALKSL